jgi:hypothetical protein
VTPGTYRYVKIFFSTWRTSNFVRWTHTGSGVNTAQEFIWHWGEFTTKFKDPLVINSGDTVQVSLEYNLAGTITTSGEGNSTMVDGGVTRHTRHCSGTTCFTPPDFIPKATKL